MRRTLFGSAVDRYIFTIGLRVVRDMTASGDPKVNQLRETHTLHPHPDRVRDPLFRAHPTFFDARDLVQVRYEMVRRVDLDRQPLARVAKDFGVTRPTLYLARSRLRQRGLPGLLPSPRGPKGPRKLSAEALAFLQKARTRDPTISLRQLSLALRKQFGIAVHPRTIRRALLRLEKKPRALRPTRRRMA